MYICIYTIDTILYVLRIYYVPETRVLPDTCLFQESKSFTFFQLASFSFLDFFGSKAIGSSIRGLSKYMFRTFRFVFRYLRCAISAFSNPALSMVKELCVAAILIEADEDLGFPMLAGKDGTWFGLN